MKSASPLVYLGIGAAIATGALFLMSQATPPARHSSASGEARDGRFQIVMPDSVRADIFLLDTHEGRVWVNTELSYLGGKPEVWMYARRIDGPEENVEFHKQIWAVDEAMRKAAAAAEEKLKAAEEAEKKKR